MIFSILIMLSNCDDKSTQLSSNHQRTRTLDLIHFCSVSRMQQMQMAIFILWPPSRVKIPSHMRAESSDLRHKDGLDIARAAGRIRFYLDWHSPIC